MKKILIVEDEQYLAEVLKTRLESNGFGVEVAGEGWKGIELAHKATPDLIILDLSVPVGNGLWILKNLKAKPDTKDIPVVILTGMRDENYKDKVLAEGVSLYMEKPYDGEELIKKLHDILSRKTP